MCIQSQGEAWPDLNVLGIQAHSTAKRSFGLFHMAQGTVHTPQVTVSVSIIWVQVQCRLQGSTRSLQVTFRIQGAA